MSLDDHFSSDEDDELLLELSSRPPRATQLATQISQNYKELVPNHSGTVTEQSQNATDHGLTYKLNEARGEASMLRDKITLLDSEREHEKKLQQAKIENLNGAHLLEENNLKQIIQRLEDEKKFLIMSAKTASTAASSSPATPTSINSTRIRNSHKQKLQQENSSPIIKKRKLDELSLNSKKNVNVPLNPNRITLDETSEFFDAIISHKLIGVDLTTMEILNKLKLGNIENFQLNNFKIPKNESIGKSLFQLLSNSKRTLPLDRCIDTLLENIAFLIKEISFDSSESNVAVPFLIAIMYQTIIFRPSAVQPMVLKDLFLFFCDLIKKYQHVIKEPLHPPSQEQFLKPQIFQYELIDNLIIFNSFDLLEISLRILQSHSITRGIFIEIFDTKLSKSLEQIYKLSLPISYKLNLKVIFNMVEILNTIAKILEDPILKDPLIKSDTKKDLPILSSWWKDCITRLYHILSKDIKNVDIHSETDLNFFFSNRYHDSFGLIRNMGDNRIAKFISKLIDPNIVQSKPKVISKDDIPVLEAEKNINFQFEYWSYALKNEILNLFDTLLTLYPNDPTVGNAEMLSNLTRLVSKEQESLLQRSIGQNSPNIMHVINLIEHLILIIYQIWTKNRPIIEAEQIKGIENELVMTLWRIVTSSNETLANPKRSKLEMKEHRLLVDQFNEMTLKDEVKYFEDAFEDMPDYIQDELEKDLEERTSKIMQIKYDDIYVEMARQILESELGSFGSMENADSLYVAMGL